MRNNPVRPLVGTTPPDTGSAGGDRWAPASVLLLAHQVSVGNAVRATLERAVGPRLWIWHEATLAPALKMVSVCRLRLILLDPVIPDVSPGLVLRALRQATPETPLVVLATRPDTPLAVEQEELGTARARSAGAVAVVPWDHGEVLVRVVREVLGIPPGKPQGR